MPPYRNYIYEYHAKITSGEIIAGKWIKKIYEIIINGLQKQEYFFNAKAANKAIRFIENFCHHSKGRNDLIKLELWQKAIVSVIFGIQDAEKIRIFREIFIVIGRKNGKSLFASAIIAYMAYLEPEYGQEIYCLAPKLDQAALVYDGFYQMVQAEDELAELAKKRRSDIYIAESNTVIKPIAFNAKKSDGFNPQLVVCDEMAAWSGDAGLKQYEVMKSALGARTQPMILSISTAGYINDSIYDELMKRSTSFLKGNSKERRLLPFLYMIDDVEKWNDIDELKKANPNMGVSVKESFFMDEIAVAEGSLSKKAEFLTKYCNIKQNSSIAWLEYQTVENAGVEKTLEDFRDCYAVGGIDLSQTTDLTAASVVIQKDGTLYAFTQFFMPRGRLEYLQATDGVPYDIFVKKGLITLSGENYVDYHDVYGWFTMLLEDYGIRPLKIGYDRYSAQYLITDMANYGFHMDDVYQGENLTPVNSDDGAKGLKSEYGCAPMTGTESMNWYNFVERLAKSGKRLPNYAEFCAYAFGSPAGLDNANTNAWSATSNTGRGVTGSVVNAVSSVGVVDAVGRVWEWLDELITRAEHATNADYHASVAWGWDKKSPLNTGEKSYDVGNIYQYYAYSLAALRAGGNWGHGANCGARAVAV